MGLVQCEFCGKKVKTNEGLLRHQRYSSECLQAKNRMELHAKGGDESKPSGQEASGRMKKSKALGKRKDVLEEEDSKPAAKVSKILDMDTMQRLAKIAGVDKGRLKNLVQKELQNPWQKGVDNLGWLPYDRKFVRQDVATLDNADSISEEDNVGFGDDDGTEGQDSDATGDEGSEIATSDDASAEETITPEERLLRQERSEQTSKRFLEYVEKFPFNYIKLSDDEVRAIRIMLTLVKKRAPLDTYPEVMAWHLREIGLLGCMESVGQSPHFISRKKLMKKLKKRYHMDHQYAKQVTITLPHSKSKVAVWKKLAQDNVLSLLTDPRWTDEDWLFFGDDPFARPPDDYPFIEDLNTGEAYLQTHKRLITKPNQILVALPLYIDGAVTGQFDKLQVTALKMSIGLLNRRARDKEHAWRNLGFVSNYTKEDTRGKKIFIESGHVAAHELYMDGMSDAEEEGVGTEEAEVDKAADYHAILDVLLESIKEIIADGMVMDIAYRGKVYKNCELVFFVPFVKCDGDEGDKLCCSYRSRGKDISQLCRYCQCPNDQTDNPKANYPFKTEPMMRELYEKRNLQKHKELSQNCIKNAFHGVRFGLHNDRGIHGATPWELLHAILLGHYKYIRDCFFAQLGETSATAQELNALAQEIGRLMQRQSDRNKPRTKFAKGILKGKLMAKEYAGVLLVMAAVLQSKKGKQILQSARRKDFRKFGQVSDWVLLVETMLQWECYLTQPKMDKKLVKRLKRKHQYLLFLLKRVGKRDKGMGFKIMKFHAVLHLAEDIRMFGVPMVVDTGSNESHHKTTKIAAKLTQKDVQTFERQTSDRLDDFQVLELAMAEVNGLPLWQYYHGTVPQDTEEVDKPNTTGGMIFNVFRDATNQQVTFKVLTRMESKASVAMDTQFLDYTLAIQEDIAKVLDKDLAIGQAKFKVPICAEHKRGGQIFRTHPNFRGKGPWRDWVMVQWNVGEFPAQIWGFLDLRTLPTGTSVELGNGTIVDQGIWAVIESCSYVPTDDGDRPSEIFKRIILDTQSLDDKGNPKIRRFYLVDVATFVRSVVVIPNIGTKCEYLMMSPKVQWAEDFESWVQAPHADEEEEMAEEEDSSDG